MAPQKVGHSLKTDLHSRPDFRKHVRMPRGNCHWQTSHADQCPCPAPSPAPPAPVYSLSSKNCHSHVQPSSRSWGLGTWWGVRVHCTAGRMSFKGGLLKWSYGCLRVSCVMYGACDSCREYLDYWTKIAIPTRSHGRNDCHVTYPAEPGTELAFSLF